VAPLAVKEYLNIMNINDNKVVVNFINSKNYPDKIPFDPPEKYPEYTGDSLNPENKIYAGVRDTLNKLGLDSEHYDTPQWNPFKDLINPGMTVFIKPNTVTHEHEEKKDVYSVITHASIVRPLLDYVCKALHNSGRIIVGDSQLYYCNFEKAMKISRIEQLLQWYKEQTPVEFEWFDLRMNKAYRTWLYGRWGRTKVEQDPLGYHFVDLGERSCFNGIDPARLRIAVSSYKNMYKHHSNGKHEYLFPGSFLQSDVVISIPKLKTHRRTAVTLALKNFMGIPSWKDSLPHFITGSVQEGGDQYIYPSMRKRICTFLHDQVQTNPYTPVKFVCAVTKRLIWDSHKIIPFKDDVYEAMWYGNDTLWRTLVDLNRAVIYADKKGKICDIPQRKLFFMLDGVVAGEKNGPLVPDPVYPGVLLGAFNPVTTDAVGATLMGFDIEKIPLIRNAFESPDVGSRLFEGDLKDIRIINGDKIYNLNEFKKQKHLDFEPHPNWKGHVELN